MKKKSKKIDLIKTLETLLGLYQVDLSLKDEEKINEIKTLINKNISAIKSRMKLSDEQEKNLNSLQSGVDERSGDILQRFRNFKNSLKA